MASSAGRAKRDREKARQERQQAKRVRRQGSQPAAVEQPQAPAPHARVAQTEVLARLAELHQRFADGTIAFDEFEQERSELLGELEV